jgi:hypothetical protein
MYLYAEFSAYGRISFQGLYYHVEQVTAHFEIDLKERYKIFAIIREYPYAPL